ncbi:MAG: hypothetical protein CMP11_02565 [Zetaproteobacteria bacterium]|nr:hypothetical protein [Pseudobdellovibrionaceae bacterium]|tara:strand:+ start:1827 stop:2606 length:780 start_codon:yes stop_codon:yes gene_type:complete
MEDTTIERFIKQIKQDPHFQKLYKKTETEYKNSKKNDELYFWILFFSNIQEEKKPFTKSQMIKSLIYRISLFYNRIWHTVKIRHSSKWWNQITKRIFLGALPLKNHRKKMCQDNIKVVLSMVEDFERRKNFIATPVNKVMWEELGIENYQISVPDFNPLKLDAIYDGVSIVNRSISEKKNIYIHCKAGKSRSAAIVLSYLSTYGKFDFYQALHIIKERRSIIQLKGKMKNLLLFYHIYGLVHNDQEQHLNFLLQYCKLH